jgi:hypothetical protein
MKRSTRRPSLLAVIGMGVLLACLAAGAALASGGNSGSAKICQKGGWASSALQNGSGQPLTFSSEDECVSYGAHGGELFKPSLVAVPSHAGEEEGSTVTASGFHPSTTASLTNLTLGDGGGSITLPATTDASGSRVFSQAFTSGACALGITGAQLTFTDSFGVHASTIITLDCP